MRRRAVLECLGDGPREKRGLTERLDVSRQTVDRSVRELEAAALVERADEGYRLTLVGNLAYREFESLLERYDRLRLARDLLAYLPPETGLDVDCLLGAEVVHAGHPMPHEPVRELERLVESAAHLVGYSPIAFPQYVSLFYEQITRTDTEIELFLDAPLVEQLRSKYDEKLREGLAAPNFTLYRLSESLCPNMGILIADGTTVWIGIYDETGNVRGSITTEADSALAWARTHLDGCRDHGREVRLRSTGR
ncbi:transcriptional regulator-like protein [Halalkalicoccus jeotgali B3]|uniref:Transcriptional regulator protein-like protein n=2 Tax=Halalkalicoccus jeotgali TaxID=413810 RepID=D8J880_HALJB|nr:transcriptional regulator protein-like protein [Halalkalicoccus jeotgali B3]ELY34625.1 transcriptional regulator-like protein [Halalkalicoccus jeotgali B3]